MRFIFLLTVITLIAGCKKEVPEPQDQPLPVSSPTPPQSVSVCWDTITFTDENYVVTRFHVNHYDSADVLIKLEMFEGNVLERSEVYEYASGFVNKMTIYNSAGTVDYYVTYARNGQGLVIREKKYHNNTLTIDYEYIYNPAGERTRVQVYDVSTGALDWYEESQYDSYHNLVYTIALEDNGDTIREHTHSYIYNSSGKILERLSCDYPISSCSKIVNTYSGDTLIEQDYYFYSTDATPINIFYYQYDSLNRLSQEDMHYGTGQFVSRTKYNYCE